MRSRAAQNTDTRDVPARDRPSLVLIHAPSQVGTLAVMPGRRRLDCLEMAQSTEARSLPGSKRIRSEFGPRSSFVPLLMVLVWAFAAKGQTVVTVGTIASPYPTTAQGSTTAAIEGSVLQPSQVGPVPGVFVLTRTDSSGNPITSGSLSVNFSLAGNAVQGQDYLLMDPSPTVFLDGLPYVNVSFVPVNSGTQGRSVTLNLSSGSGYTVGNPGTASIPIGSPPVALPGVLGLAGANAAAPAERPALTYLNAYVDQYEQLNIVVGFLGASAGINLGNSFISIYLDMDNQNRSAGDYRPGYLGGQQYRVDVKGEGGGAGFTVNKLPTQSTQMESNVCTYAGTNNNGCVSGSISSIPGTNYPIPGNGAIGYQIVIPLSFIPPPSGVTLSQNGVGINVIATTYISNTAYTINYPGVGDRLPLFGALNALTGKIVVPQPHPTRIGIVPSLPASSTGTNSNLNISGFWVASIADIFAISMQFPGCFDVTQTLITTPPGITINFDTDQTIKTGSSALGGAIPTWGQDFSLSANVANYLGTSTSVVQATVGIENVVPFEQMVNDGIWLSPPSSFCFSQNPFSGDFNMANSFVFAMSQSVLDAQVDQISPTTSQTRVPPGGADGGMYAQLQTMNSGTTGSVASSYPSTGNPTQIACIFQACNYVFDTATGVVQNPLVWNCANCTMSDPQNLPPDANGLDIQQIRAEVAGNNLVIQTSLYTWQTNSAGIGYFIYLDTDMNANTGLKTNSGTKGGPDIGADYIVALADLDAGISQQGFDFPARIWRFSDGSEVESDAIWVQVQQSSAAVPGSFTVTIPLSAIGATLASEVRFYVQSEMLVDTGSSYGCWDPVCLLPNPALFQPEDTAPANPFVLCVNPNGCIPSITTTSLPSGTAGIPYSQSLSALGGTPPYSGWSLTSGSLPPGLSLNSSTGVIAGTPSSTSGSPFNFTVTVADSASGVSAPQSLSITVAQQTQTITFGTISNQTVGSTVTLSATASSSLAVSYSSSTTSVCTVSGTVVTLVAAGTCTISASQPGNATYAAATPVSHSFTVGVPAVLSINATPVGNFTRGQQNAYSVTVSNSGSTPTSGTVTVAESLLAGLTVVSISGGSLWSCSLSSSTCTRSDSLAAGSSYSTITVTVSVAANAPSSVTNHVTVSGGGSASATASNVTNIATPTYAAGALTIPQGASLTLGSLDLVMQGDGNLVLYQGGTAIWSTGTYGQNCGASKCAAIFQGDGNFVVYNGPTPLWSSGTFGNPGAQLLFSGQLPQLEIIGTNQSVLWTNVPEFSAGNFTLAQGTSFVFGSSNLAMQGDGNLVLYQGGKAVWSTGTFGQNCGVSQCIADFQADGNFVVYNGSAPLWTSRTSANPGATLVLAAQSLQLQIISANQSVLWTNLSFSAGNFTLSQGASVSFGSFDLVMQSDGNLVLYPQSGPAVWSTGTEGQNCGAGHCITIFQGDGNLVVYDGSSPLWSSGTFGNSGANLVFSSQAPQLQIINGNSVLWAN